MRVLHSLICPYAPVLIRAYPVRVKQSSNLGNYMCKAREQGLGWLFSEDSCAIDLQKDQEQGGGSLKN